MKKKKINKKDKFYILGYGRTTLGEKGNLTHFGYYPRKNKSGVKFK